MTSKNKWILITGASTGIGRACAEYLAQNGFKVYAGARKQEDIIELDSIDNITSLKIDVTDYASIKNATNQIKENKSGLFGLINNAGIAKGGPLMEIPVEELQHQFNVNLFGIHRVTKACFPLLLESKGRIIMMSSNSGFFASPFFGPYNSSKFALEGYSDSLRRELALFGVKVVIIQPGRIKTPIWDKGEDLLHKFDGTMFENFIRELGTYAIEKGKNDSLDPNEVAKLVFEGLTKEKPKTRYMIVPDKFRNRMLKILPDKMIDKIILKELEKVR